MVEKAAKKDCLRCTLKEKLRNKLVFSIMIRYAAVNNNNNNNVSISVAQSKLSSVSFMAVQLCIVYLTCSLHANDMCMMCLVSLLSEGFIYKCKELFACWAECCHKTALCSKYCLLFIGAIYIYNTFIQHLCVHDCTTVSMNCSFVGMYLTVLALLQPMLA